MSSESEPVTGSAAEPSADIDEFNGDPFSVQSAAVRSDGGEAGAGLGGDGRSGLTAHTDRAEPEAEPEPDDTEEDPTELGESGLETARDGAPELGRMDGAALEAADPGDLGTDPDRDDEEIELVIGIARGIGTPSSLFVEQLTNSLANYGYQAHEIKISNLLEDDLRFRGAWDNKIKPWDRSKKLIEHGNRLCAEDGAKDALVLRVVDVIRDRRQSELLPLELSASQSASGSENVGDGQENKSAESDEPAVPTKATSISTTRRVWIINSLKRVDEVTTLRNMYGDHFILFGLGASERLRRQTLVASFEANGIDAGENPKAAAKDLMEQDYSEPGAYGQDILRTLPLADVFVSVDSDERAILDTRRAIALLFGDPEATGPTVSEYAMQLASQTSTLSPELGLRVGAVVVSSEGDVLAVGTNKHPIDVDSPQYDAAAVDLRQLTQDLIARLGRDKKLKKKIKAKFLADQDGFVTSLFAGALKSSELRALTEYQRPVHAEMNALMAALRQRVDLGGATIYVTDFPCHNCAKHLIAAGLGVVYLSPYAKSKATKMYGRHAKKFRSFRGVAPTRYESFFIGARIADRKDPSTGARLHWDPSTKQGASPMVTPQISMEAKEKREAFATSLAQP